MSGYFSSNDWLSVSRKNLCIITVLIVFILKLTEKLQAQYKDPLPWFSWEHITDVVPYRFGTFYVMFPINKNIFLHVLNITIKIRKLTLIHYYYIICRHQSRLLIVPTILFFWAKRSSSESQVLFSCHVFFVSFGLEKFLILSLTSSSWHFWRLQDSDFIGSPSF